MINEEEFVLGFDTEENLKEVDDFFPSIALNTKRSFFKPLQSKIKRSNPNQLINVLLHALFWGNILYILLCLAFIGN